MGRLIDVSELYNAVMLNKSDWGIFATPIDQLVESLVSQVSTVEAIPKTDYENRLKADMVAMLEDLDLQIDESAAYNLKVAKVQRLIRNKIDKLKREDLPHCQYTDEEIAKSFIEDVEAVKDQLPTTKNDLGVDCVDRGKEPCYTCRFCKINSHGSIYCSLREKGGKCYNHDSWESQEDVLDKIRAEIEELDYITFDGITKRKCLEIIDKYKAEGGEQL